MLQVVNHNSRISSGNHPEKISKELKENSEKFNWAGIHFPARFKDIDKFEEKKSNNLYQCFWL